jgi:hypothetical protein
MTPRNTVSDIAEGKTRKHTVRFEVLTAVTMKMPSSGMLCHMALVWKEIHFFKIMLYSF